MPSPRVTAIHPLWAIEGGRISIDGAFPIDASSLPEVHIGEQRARVVYASSSRLAAIVPAELDGGRVTVRVACGLAFADDGTLFVGDRSGTIFRVDAAGRAMTFASLPASVAAFHLAMGPDGALYVTGPTLSPYDTVYRIDREGNVTTTHTGF